MGPEALSLPAVSLLAQAGAPEHGFLTLVPALLAIALAIATRQVLLALFSGVWAGTAILEGSWNPLPSLLRSADTYVVGSLADSGHASILLFSLCLGGLVGVISATGGVRGIVEVVSRLARGPRSGQVATWILGLLIFFDDYANSLIVGNTMRPFSDRVRISREKLSFIVDATAAPVATIGVISTWTAYQLGQIEPVLARVSTATTEPYDYFLHSIPYSFYSLLMIALVFLVAVTLRDFGPMRRAEARCRETGEVLRDGAQPLLDPSLDLLGDSPDVKPRWYNAAVPVICVVAFTFAGLVVTGWEALGPEASRSASIADIIGKADSFKALLWASLGASAVAGLMGLLQGFRLAVVVNSWVAGVRSLVLAVMILVLAWAISQVCEDLHTGDYVASVTSGVLTSKLVPALAFVTAGFIAFSTGTSYGTMAILIPIFLPLVYTLSGDAAVASA
ncbi:MAG: Na+/H+ antiporter NhaC family protein, partial [Planctomycetota bacterium]|nr:Na+/H+ antiporter NhaC family protein [Planctomycetota bacterium]